MQQSTKDEKVAVVVPLFPRMPGIRMSLDALSAQTRRPDIVVLLDDGKHKDADAAAHELRDIPTEVVQVSPGPVPVAINRVVEHLSSFGFISFLRAGNTYAPERIERCLEALRNPDAARPPAVAVTALRIVDSRGETLPLEDRRCRHNERLWEPGRSGISLAEWLGAGNFPGPMSNVFVRRSFLAENPLPENVPVFVQWLTVVAGLRGLLSVIDKPLLHHYPGSAHPEHSASTTTDSLRTQANILRSLQDRIQDSTDTRRNLANYHRAAWQNVSGVREDLFQQVALCLASSADEESVEALVQKISNSLGASTLPAHLENLIADGGIVDVSAYAAALQRTKELLAMAEADNSRLARIASAAGESGWIRFGAWLGNRSSRQMLEMDELRERGLSIPDSQFQSVPKSRPQPVGRKRTRVEEPREEQSRQASQEVPLDEPELRDNKTGDANAGQDPDHQHA